MPIDPLTATAIAATGKWMWDSFGKSFVDKAAGGRPVLQDGYRPARFVDCRYSAGGVLVFDARVDFWLYSHP